MIVRMDSENHMHSVFKSARIAAVALTIMVVSAAVGMAQPPSTQRPGTQSPVGGFNTPPSMAANNFSAGPTTNAGGGYSPQNDGMAIPPLESDDPTTQPADDAGGSAPGMFSGLVARLLSGGPLMIPLGLCSLVVIALAVERLVALRRGRVIPRPFVRRFTECVQDGQLTHEEALTICDEFDCPVAEVFHATVKRWGRPTVEIEQAVMDAGERVAEGLRKYLRLFSAVSNVAPLLGLLGTVVGMIEAFEALSGSATDVPSDSLAAGISEALMTTAAGLSVAIPAYLAYVYFSSRADRYLVEIDALCQQVVDCISAEGMQTSSNRGGNRRTKRAA
jgi:biopolymer transport protein ExbB